MYVENKSLKEWLEIGYGEALNECISAAKYSLHFQNYLIILDVIIPPVPKFTVNRFYKTLTIFSTQNNDLEQFECLISTIARDFFRIINTEKFPPEISDQKGIGADVILKVVYYAGKQTINDDFISWKLKEYLSIQLIPFCKYRRNRNAVALIIILLEKMSENWLQIFSDPKLFFLTKMEVMQNVDNRCDYVDCLRKLYYELDLEGKFYKKFPNFRTLQDNLFDIQNLTMALRSVAQIINEYEIQGEQFFISGLLYKLHSLLSNPSEIGDQTFVIKSFLTVFLSFEIGTGNNYTWKSNMFEKLVLLGVNTLDYLFDTSALIDRDEIDSLNDIYYIEYNYSEIPVRNTESFKNVAIVTMELLESLYILNSSWHEWFDIGVENKLIEDRLFESRSLNVRCCKEYKKYDDHQTISDKWIASLSTICPATVSALTRKEMFMSLTPILDDRNESNDVSRSNVLGYVFDKIRQDDAFMSYYWDFTFQDEIASGPGVTREAYSILSDELQRHYSDLCREEPNEMSDNELIHAHSPDDGKAIEEYKFLGNIMAKTILDVQLLDIPLRSEIFQRLRAIKCKKYSHLRRDNFGLLQTLPQLEPLFKQLLEVKRKVEVIRAEVGLSQRQKKEIISNLTFDDGNSFDDLCLNFIVPGTNVELIEGGSDVFLSPHNIDLYIETLCAHTVQLQQRSEYKLKAIRDGIDEILSPANIDLFLPKEFKELICGEEFQRLTEKDLNMFCDYDESPSIQFLFQCLASFDAKRQRLFLRFVTGRTCLPYAGLSRLKPRLTIKTISRDHADSSLPSSATCSNLLYLPEYSSLSVTRQKLLYAIEECNDSFGIV